MNQKEIDWHFFVVAKFLKEKSINCPHYETNITYEPFENGHPVSVPVPVWSSGFSQPAVSGRSQAGSEREKFLSSYIKESVLTCMMKTMGAGLLARAKGEVKRRRRRRGIVDIEDRWEGIGLLQESGCQYQQD